MNMDVEVLKDKRLMDEYNEYRTRSESQEDEIMSLHDWARFRFGRVSEINRPEPPVSHSNHVSQPEPKPDQAITPVEDLITPVEDLITPVEDLITPVEDLITPVEQPERESGTVEQNPEPEYEPEEFDEAPFEDEENGEIAYEPELSVGEYPEYEPEEFDEPEQPSSPESVNIPSPVVEPVDESKPDGQPKFETVEPEPEQPEIVEDEQPLALTLKAQLDQATVKYDALTDMLDAITDKRNALEIEMEVLSIKLQQIPKSNKPLSPSRKKADDILESMLDKLNLNQGK